MEDRSGQHQRGGPARGRGRLRQAPPGRRARHAAGSRRLPGAPRPPGFLTCGRLEETLQSRCGVVALVVLAVAVVLTVPRLAAAVPLLLCAGSYTTTYDPGLTFTAQDVAVETQRTYDPCLLHPTITSGTEPPYAFTLQTASCLDLDQGLYTGESTITWNTGETTTSTWVSTGAQVGDTIVTTTVGPVTAGKFLGRHVFQQTITSLTALEAACASANGLQQETGAVLLTITWP